MIKSQLNYRLNNIGQYVPTAQIDLYDNPDTQNTIFRMPKLSKIYKIQKVLYFSFRHARIFGLSKIRIQRNEKRIIKKDVGKIMILWFLNEKYHF